MDDEIQTCKTQSKYIQSHQVAIPVPFTSFRSKSFGLTFSRDWKTTVNLFNAQHSFQFACTKRSFTSACVLCSSFNGSSLSSRMTCWVRTLTVKVPVTLSKELPAGLGLHSARTINLPAGLGLRSANSSNLSADVGLRTASRNSNKMFQLIVRYVFTVRFKQQYQSHFSFRQVGTNTQIRQLST
jgi:hypothetical protein